MSQSFTGIVHVRTVPFSGNWDVTRPIINSKPLGFRKILTFGEHSHSVPSEAALTPGIIDVRLEVQEASR
jgi:hypothetical protein